jgi:hypothetical protein
LFTLLVILVGFDDKVVNGGEAWFLHCISAALAAAVALAKSMLFDAAVAAADTKGANWMNFVGLTSDR